MPQNIRIIKADASHILRIEELIENGYRRDIAKKGWTHEVDLLKGDRLSNGEIEKTLNDVNSAFFIAIDANEIVQGVICVARNNDWIEFGKFAVNPELQGQGIGKKLISKVENFVKTQWHSNRLLLSVISIRIELIEFYKRLGFAETGEKMDFIKIHPYVVLKDGAPNLEVLIMEKHL